MKKKMPVRCGRLWCFTRQVKKVFQERVMNCIKFCSLVKMWNILIYFLVSEIFPFIILYEYNIVKCMFFFLGSGTLGSNISHIRRACQWSEFVHMSTCLLLLSLISDISLLIRYHQIVPF